MKKVLSVFLAVAMLFGMISATAVAASDTCIRLSDTSGSTGYSAGSDTVNSWVVANDGATLIFDVLVESVATPASGMVSRLVAFTGDAPYNYTGYDFTNGKFTAGTSHDWITSAKTTTYTEYSSNKFTWELNRWYEIAFQFNGDEATVYLDGIPMVSAEIDKVFATDYIVLYPQYCTILIDNLRVCGKDYNVRDRYGVVNSTTDFTGVTSASSTSNWVFSGTGYSVSTKGRPMPELNEMLPTRTVAPAISGAYLTYSEAGGTGTVLSGVNFTNYNGFSIVQDIRTDRKSAYGNFAVRFGTNYIAGYDWDNNCFRISQRSGYGFNTTDAYTYAKTDYTLNLKETYEFGVRQDGNAVSVYLNGVLVAHAVNDAFATGYDKVEVSCYRIGAAIDNLVVAYPDYNIREAEGGGVKLTFDESVDYINSKCAFALNGTNGYSLAKASDAAAVIVNDTEATDGTANVDISFANCPDITAFELQIAYPSTMSVAKSTVAGGLGGTSTSSQTTANPYIFTYVAKDGNTITNADVLNVTFNTPEAYGDYEITATLIPYVDDVPCTPVTGVGTVTVPEPALNEGLPSGLAYDGETLTWDAAEGAFGYEIVMLFYGDESEISIDITDACEYYLPYTDYIPDPGVYIVRIYMYDENMDIVSVSKDFTIIVEEDAVYGGLNAYYQELSGRLAALAEGPYSSANQITVNTLLANARTAMLTAGSYDAMVAVYEDYAARIAEIPVSEGSIVGDVDGDSQVSLNDFTLLNRILNGATVAYAGDADIDSDGNITLNDFTKLNRILNGANIT